MQALAAGLPAGEGRPVALEMAPGSVLKGLMRRIDRSLEVKTHDQPAQPVQPAPTA
jgi:malonyl CoA-acyl carrier protein transacylase